MYKIFLFVFTFIVLAVAVSSRGLANEQRYQFEVIVFSHFTAAGINAENWPLVKVPDFTDSNMLNLGSNNLPLLSDRQFRLNNSAKKLQQDGYKILLHLAWVESASQLQKNQSILINNLYQPNSDNYTQEISGSITISLQRFFNLNFNLYFATPVTTLQKLATNNYFNSISSGLFYFHLLQNRRTRSEELNYIDHPLYGILFKIFKL